MQLGQVIGTVVSTKKDERLVGYKLLVVRSQGGGGLSQDQVAVDMVGAGIGEQVLVVTGGGARQAVNSQNTPVDAAVVGIVDSWEER